MLSNIDLEKLSPFLSAEKVVNIELKDYGQKGREIIIEYQSGKKIVGNLDESPFVMNEVSGLTSIASYFARGKYGSSTWRGNCSGLLIKDLLQFYKPDTFADLAVGSGTSIEVAKALGYTKTNTVFSDLNPQYGGIDLSDSHLDFPLMDFIFFHPPYYVFPGSSMPVYSGKEKGGMWGEEIHPRDGSRISNPVEFKKWFDACNANLYKLLHNSGRLAILMGDSRFKGKYYSMFKNMNLFGELEQVIIKQQHNCISSSKKYGNAFIPIQHEYLVVIKKNSPYIVPITAVSFLQRDIRESKVITWAALIAMVLENNNGKMAANELVQIMRKHPKGKHNHHCDAKLRQQLQMHPKMFFREGNQICLSSINKS